MHSLNSIVASHANLENFAAHLPSLSAAEQELAAALIEADQAHLFAGWDAPGTGDAEKRAFFDALSNVHASYPGGLPGYIENARKLLAEASAGTNPFEGCTPAQPDLVDLSQFGAAYESAEATGFQAFAQTAVVLVAGGLGERLGYNGIKLDIPVEVTTSTSYLALYTSFIKAASKRHGRPIPLVIMTSRDTDAGTRATLEANANFGLEPGQVTILRQELVPALSDVQAHLALDGKYSLALKPHGHGDIHMLLHSSGTAARLAQEGVRYLLFIQDTNGQAINAAFAAIGVSEREGYDFNSIAVNRIPGEAVGGIAKLIRQDAPDLTLNVEYNQLDPLLRATISPEGDVPNAEGFSMFPGNINIIVIRLEPYLRVLQATQGIIAEFVNPKFADATRTTFKKPARLETMMQDLPKNFVSGERTGVTVFDRAWCFSACKNNLADAAAKVAAGGPPESASSAENDFYLAGRMRLKEAGMTVTDGAVRSIRGVPICEGPRVILRPSFALTRADVRDRIRGGSIAGKATLIVEGDVHLENITLDPGTTLVVKAPEGKQIALKDLHLTKPGGYELVELTDAEMASTEVPEYLRIRGYRIVETGGVCLQTC